MNSVCFAVDSSIRSLTESDMWLKRALENEGYTVRITVWGESLPSQECRALVIRETWNYHHQPDNFLRWVSEVERDGILLLNSAALVRWNMRKTYLLEVAKAGIPVVPSLILSTDTPRAQIQSWVSTNCDKDIVLKPLVGASGDGVKKYAISDFFDQLMCTEGLIQPYLSHVEEGEISCIYVEGLFSHAIARIPKKGSFLANVAQGATVHLIDPPSEVRRYERALHDLLPSCPLYSRLDWLFDGRNYLLAEVELIEPGLFATFSPTYAAVFAEAITKRLERAKS
ncbi:MAG: hypothetical protein RIQ56_830 [Candidatus Parcubacteria bacterium]|jgi:glutathione synthase/RimK-type ligase-like ATP-grasp enzyme